MKYIILGAFTSFSGFILGITYTVQAADVSGIVHIIAIVKGLMQL